MCWSLLKVRDKTAMIQADNKLGMRHSWTKYSWCRQIWDVRGQAWAILQSRQQRRGLYLRTRSCQLHEWDQLQLVIQMMDEFYNAKGAGKCLVIKGKVDALTIVNWGNALEQSATESRGFQDHSLVWIVVSCLSNKRKAYQVNSSLNNCLASCKSSRTWIQWHGTWWMQTFKVTSWRRRSSQSKESLEKRSSCLSHRWNGE